MAATEITPAQPILPTNPKPSIQDNVINNVGQEIKQADETHLDNTYDEVRINSMTDNGSVASTTSELSRNDSATHELDLNKEVSKLTQQVMNLMRDGNILDDRLRETLIKLEKEESQVSILTSRGREHERLLAEGLLISSYDAKYRQESLKQNILDEKDRQIAALKKSNEADKEAERSLRLQAEKAKRQMESEIESLTLALFTEANEMVSSARRDQDVVEKKNEQLEAKNAELEVILRDQQAQLQALKFVMEKMACERDEHENMSTLSGHSLPSAAQSAQDEQPAPSVPSLPVTPIKPNKALESSSSPLNSSAVNPNDHQPEPPLHYSYLLRPVLRTDIRAFEDFHDILKAARAASPPQSRVTSGSFGSLGAALAQGPSNVVPFSLPLSPSLRQGISSPPLPLLRDTKWYKRILQDDIEPTLRLDLAPGIMWMTRRITMNALADGSLVVEPLPEDMSAIKLKYRVPPPCAICDDKRQGLLYKRKHCFRVSEEKEKKSYPLCDLCAGKMRSCGDLLSFMRNVRDGHWRAESEEEVQSGWEELVKLRERMFWHRMSGGVIPAAVDLLQSKVHERQSINVSRESLLSPSKD